MSITHAPVRRSLVAAVALGAGLTLAACGGGDEEESTSEEAPPTDEGTSEEIPSDGGSETGSSGAGETESDAGMLPPGGESESEAGSAGGESESGAAGASTIEIEVPEGWSDLTEQAGGMAEAAGVAEVQVFGPEGGTGTTNVSVLRTEPGAASGSYAEMLEQSGQDTAAYEELEARDVDGREATGFETETDLGAGPMTQRAYGVVLDDGSVVEILLSSSVDEFPTHEDAFNQILDSVTISE